MYQNITLMPLVSADGKVNHIGIIIYDVTDMAMVKMQLEQANDELEALSRTDRLTGLNNRGYWEECLIAEFKCVHRTRAPCSCLTSIIARKSTIPMGTRPETKLSASRQSC